VSSTVASFLGFLAIISAFFFSFSSFYFLATSAYENA